MRITKELGSLLQKAFKKQPSPRRTERRIKKAAAEEFKLGVNGASIYLAFRIARQINQGDGHPLTNNRLLNIVKDLAVANSTAIVEDVMYGGVEQTMANIETEIARLREQLSDEEKRN